MKTTTSYLGFTLLLAMAALAKPPEKPSGVAVCTEVQMVSLPMAKALPLLPNLRDAGSIDGAFSQIQEMIAKGEAKLLGWPEITTFSGQRAVVEDIVEVRYATLFNPADKPAAAPKEKGAIDAELDSGGPIGFETRNVGSTLEIEPVASSDGKTIQINLVPQLVRLLGFKSASTGKNAKGEETHLDSPEFRTEKVTTSFSVPSGQRMLLGIFHTPDPESIDLFILKAEIVKPTK